MINHPLRKRYDLDSAMNAIWATYKEMFLPLFTISFISSIIINYISSGIDLSALQSMDDPTLVLETLKPLTWRYLIIALISLAFSLLLQYYIIYKPIDTVGNLAEWINKVLVRFFFPMLIVYIVLLVFALVAVMMGVVLLIIGAIFAAFYAAIFFTLAAPVMMVENRTIGETITRIFSLGHRPFGINLGWTTLFIILLLVISMLLSTLIMLPFAGGFLRTIFHPENSMDMLDFARKPSYILLASLANAVTMPLSPIFALVFYFNAASYDDERKGRSGSGNDNGSGITVEDLYSNNNNDNQGRSSSNAEEWKPTVDDLTP